MRTDEASMSVNEKKRWSGGDGSWIAIDRVGWLLVIHAEGGGVGGEFQEDVERDDFDGLAEANKSEGESGRLSGKLIERKRRRPRWPPP
jgi:hypothetical protein